MVRKEQKKAPTDVYNPLKLIFILRSTVSHYACGLPKKQQKNLQSNELSDSEAKFTITMSRVATAIQGYLILKYRSWEILLRFTACKSGSVSMQGLPKTHEASGS